MNYLYTLSVQQYAKTFFWETLRLKSKVSPALIRQGIFKPKCQPKFRWNFGVPKKNSFCDIAEGFDVSEKAVLHTYGLYCDGVEVPRRAGPLWKVNIWKNILHGRGVCIKLFTVMKYIVVVLDGASDHPLELLGGKTPLEAADITSMNSLAQKGVLGRVRR